MEQNKEGLVSGGGKGPYPDTGSVNEIQNILDLNDLNCIPNLDILRNTKVYGGIIGRMHDLDLGSGSGEYDGLFPVGELGEDLHILDLILPGRCVPKIDE